MSINIMTPLQAVCCEGKINKRWVSYRERAIDQKRTIGEISENTLPLYVAQKKSVGHTLQSTPERDKT